MRRAKATSIVETAAEVLADQKPMTVRQVYYQLVSRHIIDNKRSEYQAVSRALRDARIEGEILWEWIEDRLRKPRHVSMWDGLPDFADTVQRAYRRDVWASQPSRIECWLEKDALSGIFEEVLDPYGVTLNVGRGYDGWDSIKGASERLGDGDVILYFGDFDPSGEDMVRSLAARLASLGSDPEIIKCALTADDIELYNLPPDLAKKTDSRAAKFVAKHGDVSVELDALPANVLRERIISEVEGRIDEDALQTVREQEQADKLRLVEVLEAAR